jgi:hypothetical protein
MQLPDIKGIFQTDLIIQTSIEAMIKDLRKYPYLLDLVFASLAKDPIISKTSKGLGYIAEAKKWFLKTDIPVMVVPRIDDSKWPCITIELLESSEVENTLGDASAEGPTADALLEWPNLSGPFVVVAYTPQTGVITLPTLTDVVLVEGMFIVDDTNIPQEIQQIISDTQVQINPVSATFNNAYIRGAKPLQIARVLSAAFRETYRIGVHVNSESDRLSELYSILIFALIRARKLFLEPRGIERSFLSSNDFRRDESLENELVFTRFINFTGIVRHYVAQDLRPTIQSLEIYPQIIGGNHIPIPAGQTLQDQSWVGDLDNPIVSTCSAPNCTNQNCNNPNCNNYNANNQYLTDIFNQALAEGPPDPFDD